MCIQSHCNGTKIENTNLANFTKSSRFLNLWYFLRSPELKPLYKNAYCWNVWHFLLVIFFRFCSSLRIMFFPFTSPNGPGEWAEKTVCLFHKDKPLLRFKYSWDIQCCLFNNCNRSLLFALNNSWVLIEIHLPRRMISEQFSGYIETGEWVFGANRHFDGKYWCSQLPNPLDSIN